MNFIDIKLKIFEFCIDKKISEKERDILLEKVNEKEKYRSIPQLNFISNPVVYDGKEEYLNDKELCSRINAAYRKMIPQMKDNLKQLIKNWKLDKNGLSTPEAVMNKLTLDCISITDYKTSKVKMPEYSVTIWYNNDPKHSNSDFCENHSYRATMDLYKNGKIEYEFSL